MNPKDPTQKLVRIKSKLKIPLVRSVTLVPIPSRNQKYRKMKKMIQAKSIVIKLSLFVKWFLNAEIIQHL